LTLKAVAAAMTGSVGLLSDAAESIVNLVAAVVALLALRIAARPPDAGHNFGHGKAVDAIVGLYAPDALFLGTGSRTVVTDPAGIRQYFERALLTDRPRGATLESRSVMVLSDGAVVITGLDNTTSVRDGKPLASPGRVTFIVAKRGADWKIVHFHRSGVPGRAN
jgi:hypothetical protein